MVIVSLLRAIKINENIQIEEKELVIFKYEK